MDNQREVYIEANDNQLLYIYNDLHIRIELINTDIISSTNSPIEQLLVLLLKQRLQYIDIDQVIEIGGDLIPNLTHYCICCGNELEYPNDTFMTCGMDVCQYRSEEMILDNYIKKRFEDSFLVSKFLLETAFYAIKSNRRDKIFEPFPTNFLRQDIQIERGKLSALNDSDLNKYKDFGKLDEIIKKYSVSQLVDIINNSKTDHDIVDKIGDLTYKLIKFAIKSNKTSLRSCGIINNFMIDKNYASCYNKKDYTEDIKNFVQFEVTYHPTVEEEFQNQVKKVGNLFLFHGSSFENWYSIMRNGLKICSNSQLMTSGAAYGTGIYLSNDINLSLSYTGNICIFGVYEVLNIPNKLARNGTIFVAKDEKMLLLRYLFIPPSQNFIRQLDLNKVLNDKFNHKIQEEKKAVVKQSNSLRTKRLLNEYKKITALDQTNVGFTVQLAEEDDLDVWLINITNFDNNPIIKQDLDKFNIKVIKMEIKFPERYPIEPPFIRIISPRFLYRTGHITSGGSICMELLTKSGWSAMYSMENLVIDIKCQIVEGKGQIDMQRWREPYSQKEAQQSFYRVASSYGWI